MAWEFWVLLGALAVILYLTVSYFIYRKAFRSDKLRGDGLVDQTSAFFAPSWTWFLNSPKETVSIRAYDNVQLHAVYIASIDQKSTQTAILCHGYGSVNTDMAVIAKMYSDLGFRILMPDARGHGLSKGAFTSFGHYERYDLKRWIQYLLRTYGSTDSFLLHGVSMGAATVILASAMDLPANVKMVVADSPFIHALSVLSRSLRPKLLLLFLPGVSLITLYLHRFALGQINVLKAAKSSHLPLFVFHGDKDEICPLREAKRLVDASKADVKELYPVPGAKHAEGYILDKPGVESHLLDHLKNYFQLPKNAIPKKDTKPEKSKGTNPS